MPGMDDIFRARNKMIKVEHSRTISRMLNWNLNLENKWVKEKLKDIDFVMGIDQEGASFDMYMQYE